MAIHIHCPSCHERLEEVRQECAHCSAELPIGVLYALSAALGKTPMPTPLPVARRMPTHLTQTIPPVPRLAATQKCSPAHNSRWRPWLAATLSLLCGLGQLYNGQIAKGLVLIALGVVAVVSWQLLLGKTLALIVWTYAVVDAYLVARRTRILHLSQGPYVPHNA